jgi:DNA-binding response OmpR family regulator
MRCTFPLDPPPENAPTPGRVLLAEDDEELRRLLASVLVREGYEVVEAADGTELLARIEEAMRTTHERGTLLVLADIQMPGLSGLDVAAILRCASSTLPVVLMTAFGDDETRMEARELGVAALLDKPVDLDALRSTVRETLTHW